MCRRRPWGRPPQGQCRGRQGAPGVSPPPCFGFQHTHPPACVGPGPSPPAGASRVQVPCPGDAPPREGYQEAPDHRGAPAVPSPVPSAPVRGTGGPATMACFATEGHCGGHTGSRAEVVIHSLGHPAPKRAPPPCAQAPPTSPWPGHCSLCESFPPKGSGSSRPPGPTVCSWEARSPPASSPRRQGAAPLFWAKVPERPVLGPGSSPSPRVSQS